MGGVGVAGDGMYWDELADEEKIVTMGPLYRKKVIQINIEKGSDYLISMATGSGKSNIWFV
ncbi:hypothetical protein C1H46_034701 [Malus baccata]|uniref:Uncharacterized protein n=1 Tax=Malus baccata TaxID=106549 RepID=A0A540KZS7_MALBA|nr:hypothetical protein C1H46_034701 [Malus baccata]